MAPRSFLSALLVLSAAVVLGASEKKADPLAISMSHYITGVQSDVLVRLRVEPDARSRELTLEWLNDDLSGGSHAITLNGERAAVSYVYPLKRLSPGKYTVTAILKRNDGSELRRASHVTVIGMGRGD